MKSNAYLNGQDILNWYKTPFEMTFSKQGFPELEPLKSLDIPRRGLRILPFNYALSNFEKKTETVRESAPLKITKKK